MKKADLLMSNLNDFGVRGQCARMRTRDLVRSMSALSGMRMSSPSSPSIGVPGGSSGQATVTRRSFLSNNVTCGTTTSGINSLPLAVSVSRNARARAGWQPMANATFGGIIVAVAPVSTASRTIQLPFGPVSRTNTMNRPASRRRGYSDRESDGIVLRQGFFRIKGKSESFYFDETVVDLIPVGRVSQQTSGERDLRAWVHPTHGDQEPLAAKPLSDSVNGLRFHHNWSIPRRKNRVNEGAGEETWARGSRGKASLGWRSMEQGARRI